MKLKTVMILLFAIPVWSQLKLPEPPSQPQISENVQYLKSMLINSLAYTQSLEMQLSKANYAVNKLGDDLGRLPSGFAPLDSLRKEYNIPIPEPIKSVKKK
jgi:hypothetical protein